MLPCLSDAGERVLVPPWGGRGKAFRTALMMSARLATWLRFSATEGGLPESRDIDLSLWQVLAKCQGRGTEVGRKGTEMSCLNEEAEGAEMIAQENKGHYLVRWDPGLIRTASWTSVSPSWLL